MIRYQVLCVVTAMLCAQMSDAASRFWRGTTNTEWNNTGNWAETSGGATGFSVPTSSDAVTFDGNGNNNCDISGARTASSITISSGYTATIAMSSSSRLVVSNNFSIADGTFSLSQGALGNSRRLEINGGFTQSGGTINQNNYMNVAGDFSKTSGTFNTSTGAYLIFDGSASQSVGGTGGLTFGYMQVSNTSTGLSLSSNITIQVSLRMSDGDIDLNSNTLAIGIDDFDIGDLEHTAGFVSDGTIRRWFDGTSYSTTSDNEIRFPFGSGSNDNSMWIGCTASFTGGRIDMTYTAGYDNFTAIAPTFSDNTITVDRRNNTVWTVSSTTITTANDITIFMRTQGITGIANLSECRISGSNAAASGSHGTVSSNDISRTGLDESNLATSYYLGGNSATNRLPVSLSAFNASRQGDFVVLDWVTQTELNNDRFEVQRSTNGVDFLAIGEVMGAGTTIEVNNYTFTDYESSNLGAEHVYYRLKQIDFDGTSTFSKVTLISNRAQDKIEWYSNSDDQVVISDPSLSVHLYDLQGRQVLSKPAGHTSLDINALAPGTYIMLMHDEKGKQIKQDKLQKL